MAKEIKFNLIVDETPVRDIAGLQDNFCIEDVLELYRKGVLEKWLCVRGFKEELKKLAEVKPDDKDLAYKLADVFDVGIPADRMNEAMYSLRFYEKRTEELMSRESNDQQERNVIDGYHNGYDVLKAQIAVDSLDMPKLKAIAKEIADKYIALFALDYSRFFGCFVDDAPLMIFAILMNSHLRDYFLDHSWIKGKLGKKFLLKTEPQRRSFPVEMAGFTSLASDVVESDSLKSEALPFGCKFFKGKTDGYWKDLEEKDCRCLVVSIPDGTFVRSSDKALEEYSAKDINGNFLLLDGLVYKSNTGTSGVVYLEV